jgi:hypothetical protein
VFISKIDKAACFHTLLQVLILNNLHCTKMVPNIGLFCGFVRPEDARLTAPKNKKRQRDAGAVETNWNST